ncbi:DUF4837 family protein [Flavicella sp.]|uniref:DUF4837 family protein n=1 Tax=Flavicella sp. TaxID=2957742 RepID=UPI00261D4343|nr:DUF4837 family protein [Flavicella sp.]MDG1805272.1 DUF4837 family protein [Flavicella sp.]
MKNIFLALSLVVLFTACESKKEEKRVFLDSNGRMNHVLIVMDNSKWNGEVGDKLKDIIMTPVLGMPQQENQFDVSHVAESSFGKMFKASRNVLIVDLDSISDFQSMQNVYAKPQQIVKITAPNDEALIEMLELYQEQMITTFKNFDIENVQRTHVKKAYGETSFKTLNDLGLEMTIPRFFKKVDDTGEFLWMRQHLSGGIAKGDGTSNILVYSIPMPASKKGLVQTISRMRDTVGKKYIPGRKENMYMITEKLYTPRVFQTKMGDLPCYATFGKWEVLNDFMAGPFLNYAIEDVANNRWIVVEGFVYAPSVNKRDYMFELEAVLKSIHIK